MTRDEAIAVAIDALGYVLENDTEYLSEGAIAMYNEAHAALNRPLPPGAIKVYCYDREHGDDPHARIIAISREDAARFDALRQRERLGRREVGRYVRVIDLTTTTPVEIASHPCSLDCHCAVVVREVP